MVIFALTNVPPRLRGDLTKWCQEIQAGIYVGNVNAKIRDLLWQRIKKDLGHGEATMVFNTNNELGYDFRTTRTDREVVDYDGIPILKFLNADKKPLKYGFSKAAKYHRTRVFSKKKPRPDVKKADLVALDLETSGLEPLKNEIISLGAVKRNQQGQLEKYSCLIKTDCMIPDKITKITGLSAEKLQKEGIELKAALQQLTDFIGASVVVGWNLPFDLEFLRIAYQRNELAFFKNRCLDLLPVVRRHNLFLENYRLETVLTEYKIKNEAPHHAAGDAAATMALADKLIEKRDLRI